MSFTRPSGTSTPNSPTSTTAPLGVTNRGVGGNIGTAATTVDTLSAFNLNQTTAGQTITFPNPTNAVGALLKTITNVGSTPFTFYGNAVAINTSAYATWTGSAWISSQVVTPPSPTTLQYVYARKSGSSQTITVAQANTAAANVSLTTLSGNIPNSSGVFTLTAGRIYELSGAVYLSFSDGPISGAYAVFKWVDSSTGTAIDTSGGSGIITYSNGTVGYSNQPTANLIYTPGSNQTVVLRFTTITSFTSIDVGTGSGANGETSATIRQIVPTY